MGKKVGLSVIVIGLNEELNLARCFQSIQTAVVTASDFLESVEVLYVDSGSKDQSINVAQNYANKVYKIVSNPSAAVGRMVGLKHAIGEFVLFLDGDMELNSQWLIATIPILLELGEKSNVAGVIGFRDDLYIDTKTGNILAERKNVYRANKVRRAPHFGGAFFVRKVDIEMVGGYNIELRVSEEPDLHARLLTHGKYVLEIPIPFVRHYTPMRISLVKRFYQQIQRNGESYFFACSFWSAIKNRYFNGWVKVFPYTISVWLVDIASVAFLLLKHPLGFVLSQILLFLYLFFARKLKLFVVARIRFWGVLVFALTKIKCIKVKDVKNHYNKEFKDVQFHEIV